MGFGKERRERHAFGSQVDEIRAYAVELPSLEQSLTEGASESAIDLGIEMRRDR